MVIEMKVLMGMLYVHQTHLCRQLGKKHEETSQNNPDSLKKGKYNRMKW